MLKHVTSAIKMKRTLNNICQRINIFRSKKKKKILREYLTINNSWAGMAWAEEGTKIQTKKTLKKGWTHCTTRWLLFSAI